MYIYYNNYQLILSESQLSSSKPPFIHIFKGQFSQKLSSCHHLMLFQTCMTSFLLWITKGDV